MIIDEEFERICRAVILEGNQTTQYGCLMCYVDDPAFESAFHDFIVENVPRIELHEYGIEREPHITILYGFHPDVKPEEIFTFFDENFPKQSLNAKINKVSRFENDEYDVLKMDISSPDLTNFNKALMKEFGDRITNDYPNYHPHLTIAYLNKGSLKDLDGSTKFWNWDLDFDKIAFSEGGTKKHTWHNIT